MKAWLWERLGDPVLRRLASRMEHLEQRREATHDGTLWRAAATIGHGVRIHRNATFSYDRPGSLQLGDACRVYGEIAIFGAGTVRIDHHTFVGPGTRIWCADRIDIGCHVLISHDVDIHDANGHSLRWQDRQAEITDRFERGNASFPSEVARAPVSIQDHAWIGFKSSILKGVTIGRGAIVAAASVVTKDVAPFTMVAGNPARVIKELPE